jgi:predicted HNH restriction endonuclease
MSYLLLKKNVDYSFFNQGFTIPVDKHQIIFEFVSKIKSQGDSESISILIDNITFHVNIKNQKFNRINYPEHTNIVQIRYDGNEKFKSYLRDKFSNSFQHIMNARREIKTKGKKYINIPKKYTEFFILYTTDMPKTILMDCITSNELMILNEFIEKEKLQEERIENILDKKDSTADLKIANKLSKIRKLNQQIGRDLKEIYKHRCQICGYSSVGDYSCQISETHHIKSFIESLNNDASNIMIICPNHHRIIHKVSPRFIRSRLVYKYPNGLEEKLKLNFHL